MPNNGDQSMQADQKRQLRSVLRNKRQSLSPAAQKIAAINLCKAVRQSPLFWKSKRVALYLSSDGEISPHLLIEALWRLGKFCYLPQIKSDRSLGFLRLQPDSTLQQNRFGIPELSGVVESCPAWQLDLVLMPLVGFDAGGNRLGMGGGFYDRTFSAQRLKQRFRSPKLVGLAHQCQQVDSLPADAWDIPLDGIVTDRGWINIEKS